MRTKLFLSLICFFSTLIIEAQPITINASDIPMPNDSFSYKSLSGVVTTSPSIGSNQTWDYGSQQGAYVSPVIYMPETDPFFTNAGIDIYYDGTKSINDNYGYNVSNEYDFNTNGIEERGLYVYETRADLSAYTGNTMDSIIFPTQKILLNQPIRLLQFPMTMGTHWQTACRKTTDFSMTVSAFAMNNVPMQHAYNTTRTDTVVGYGKLRIYTQAGPSAYTDVLMVKTKVRTMDSIYMNGQPAPTQLLSAFNAPQGRVSNEIHNLSFYRKGSFSYLMRWVFAEDSTYTTPVNIFVNTNNAFLTSTQNLRDEETSTVLVYPNPATGKEIFLQTTGQVGQQISKYQITDLGGRVIASGVATAKQGACAIELPEHLTNNQYILQACDSDNRVRLQELFLLKR